MSRAYADRGLRPLRKDAAKNRERLLDAAAKVFEEQGLEASVDDVARLAGVGMGTLYRRFPSKQALIDELIRDLLTNVAADARAAISLPDGNGLRSFLFAAGAQQAARRGCLPRVWSSPGHAELLDEIVALVGELLADAQRHGRVRAEVTTTDVSVIIWSLRGVIESAGAIAPDAWRRHLEIVVDGLGPQPTTLTTEALGSREYRRILAARRPVSGE